MARGVLLLTHRRMKDRSKSNRVREGKYANYFEVGHNRFEFYVDFGQYDPNTEQVQMHTRILTSPAHAKMLGETLSGSVESFEAENGLIPSHGEETDPMEMVRQSLQEQEPRCENPRTARRTEVRS